MYNSTYIQRNGGKISVEEFRHSPLHITVMIDSICDFEEMINHLFSKKRF